MSFRSQRTHSPPTQSLSNSPPMHPSSRRYTLMSIRQWQPDSSAHHCSNPSCGRAFSLFVRKHHCRWCGFVFCDTCTARKVRWTRGMVSARARESGKVRVCDDCFRFLTINRRDETPPRSRDGSGGSQEISGNHGDVASQSLYGALVASRSNYSLTYAVDNDSSEWRECPVCGLSAAASRISTDAMTEHVKQCLEAPVSSTNVVVGDRYIVQTYSRRASTDGTQDECAICLEDFNEGQELARLNCFCQFHRHCIDAWFAKGHLCPVHYR